MDFNFKPCSLTLISTNNDWRPYFGSNLIQKEMLSFEDSDVIVRAFLEEDEYMTFVLDKISIDYAETKRLAITIDIDGNVYITDPSCILRMFVVGDEDNKIMFRVILNTGECITVYKPSSEKNQLNIEQSSL